MGEKRQNQRLNCAERCFFYCGDLKYKGAVMDISISGAMVKLNGSTPAAIRPGDSCSLLLSNDPASCFFRYKVRIARVFPAGVGVEILEHEF